MLLLDSSVKITENCGFYPLFDDRHKIIGVQLSVVDEGCIVSVELPNETTSKNKLENQLLTECSFTRYEKAILVESKIHHYFIPKMDNFNFQTLENILMLSVTQVLNSVPNDAVDCV